MTRELFNTSFAIDYAGRKFCLIDSRSGATDCRFPMQSDPWGVSFREKGEGRSPSDGRIKKRGNEFSFTLHNGAVWSDYSGTCDGVDWGRLPLPTLDP